ncbi:LRRC74A [Symbiodinium natans]|uniref:LRRC74A protein n=1 Tax=Symbiodinium natans TaxID=878477 RepID=A0A812NJH8_9DINO|nr:LRRC74A [Symbiodinium natans]
MQGMASIRSFGLLLAACHRARRWEEVLALFRRMTFLRMPVDVTVLNSTVSACETGARWQLAVHLLAEGDVTDAITRNAALASLSAGYQWQRALSLFAASANFHRAGPSSTLGTALGTALGTVAVAAERATRWTVAIEMFRHGLSMMDSLPQVASSSAVAACGRATQWEIALQLLSTLQRLQLQPAQPTCNAAISACERGHRWAISLALLRQILVPCQKCHALRMFRTSTAEDTSDADPVSWNSTLSALEKGSQWQRCLILFAEMVEADAIACNATITGCMRGEAWELALAVLQVAERQHVPLSTVSFNASIAAVGRGTRWEECLQLAAAMRGGSHRPDFITFNALAFGLRRKWQHGLALLSPDSVPALTGLRLIAESCGRAGSPMWSLMCLAPLLRKEAARMLQSSSEGQFHRSLEETHPIVPALDVLSGLDGGMVLSEWHCLSRRELRPLFAAGQALRRSLIETLIWTGTEKYADFSFFENSFPDAAETDAALFKLHVWMGLSIVYRPWALHEQEADPGPVGPARLKLMEAKEDMELQEHHDEAFVSVAQREQLKQEYWQKYNEAGSAKKTLSEFEEWQRVLHGGKAEVSTTAPSEIEDVATSRVSVEDTDWRISHLGFTRRSDHEEYVSDYYRRCRERHYIPLGPRGSTPRKAKGHAHPVVDPVAVEPGVLDFGGWSLGSDRLDMLCQAPGALDQCTRCNLSENRIEDRSVPLICEKLLPRAQALNLSHNQIGVSGMRHFETALRKSGLNTPLMELNLQGNRLGTPFGPTVAAADAYERDLCSFVDALSRATELRALSLAQNGLGRVNHELGQALGQLVSGLKNLRVLDLHWNGFHGLGAYKLLEGICDNRVVGGKLSRVDLSWNRLGINRAKKLYNPSKMLADVLANNDQLFHLDISYNSIGVEDCAMIASGLRYNSTLFGFHVAGNEVGGTGLFLF